MARTFDRSDGDEALGSDGIVIAAYWLRRLSGWLRRHSRRQSAQTARAAAPDTGIGAEAPIRAASQDLLRRAGIADRIAGVLSELTIQEGRVFAIRGAWGHGKSSLKNLIAERLDARNDGADWVDFNPWQWGDANAIARALFEQIAAALGGEYSPAAASRSEAFRDYGAILTGAAGPLKSVAGASGSLSMIMTNISVVAMASAIGFHLPSVASVAAVLAGFSASLPFLGRFLKRVGTDRTADPLNKVRASLEIRLRELDRPLVVFVDDIDRLEPDQIRLLLRQVKANANLPNIVFMLLFQPSIVEAALAPVANGDGRAFLEKIVQTSFDLPAVSATIVHQVFGDELSLLLGSHASGANGIDPTRWGNVLVGSIQPRLENMRDAKRLMSSLAVHLPLHASGDTLEINIVDFIALETVRVFEPDLHAAIFQARNLVLQSGRFRDDGRAELDRAAAHGLLATVPERRRDWAKGLLTELFPSLGWAFGGSLYSFGEWHSAWVSQKRVCSPRFFPRYFELQTAIGEVPESEFVDLLAHTDDAERLTRAVSEIARNGALASLVARFDESVDRLPVENAAILLPTMFAVAQSFVGARTSGDFNSPWISAWRSISWFLKRIPDGERGGLALEALRQTGALSVAAMIIHLSDPSDRKKGDHHEPVLDPATVAALKTEWLSLIRGLAAAGDLLRHPDLTSLLYRWRDYTGSLDEPRRWVAEAIGTDEGFAVVIDRMMNRGTSHGWGDHVVTPLLTFQRETIEDFIGIEVAAERSSTISAVDHPGIKEALPVLRHHIELWLARREPDATDL